MTTPAVSINNTFSSLKKVWFGDDLHGIYNTSMNVLVNTSWFKKARPASTTVPFAKRGGWRAPRGWSHTGTLGSFPGNTVQFRSNSPSGVGYEYITYTEGSYWNLQVPASPSTAPTDLISQAEIRALNKLKRGNVQLGIVMAEAKETADLLGGAMRHIAKQTNRFIDSYPKEWAKVKKHQVGHLPSSKWKNIPNRWLELQYGWKPLMSDVSDALSTLEHWRDTVPPIIGVHTRVQRTNDVFSNHSAISDTSSYFTVRYRTKYDVFVDLHYSMSNSTLARLSSLGLTDPLGIVWEKVKFSFVVDWFVPIGGWLSSLRADDGYTFQGGSRSLITRLEETAIDARYSKPGYKLLSGGVPTYEVKSFNFLRQVYGSSPVPGLYFKNPLSSAHLANALSLLTQAFRR